MHVAMRYVLFRDNYLKNTKYRVFYNDNLKIILLKCTMYIIEKYKKNKYNYFSQHTDSLFLIFVRAFIL